MRENRWDQQNQQKNQQNLTDRQKQILGCMDAGKEYKTEEVAEKIGLKGPRTRQLLNELVDRGFVMCTAMTKKRRYVRIGDSRHGCH